MNSDKLRSKLIGTPFGNRNSTFIEEFENEKQNFIDSLDGYLRDICDVGSHLGPNRYSRFLVDPPTNLP